MIHPQIDCKVPISELHTALTICWRNKIKTNQKMKLSSQE